MKLISKSIYLSFIFFIFSLMLFTNQSFANDNKRFQLKPGDIIVTKGPVLNGFFGHCSLAIDHDTVLQIEGPGDKPMTEDFESYRDRYGKGKNEWIKVYRCSHPNAGTKATQWAKKHYENSDSEYLVTFNLKSETFTYCTKIIYQAYKYGVDKNSVSDHGLYIISPYALTDNFTDEYKLKLVKTY
ncbi:hypothetical protein PYH55_09515 [Staphylococcus epidermidis]|nr:hypothetical protein PYH55_09515 [Staphylococcus epidermidis]WHI76925.1 hypothetical protein PYH75_09520 [Staphylococcus epidermidis]